MAISAPHYRCLQELYHRKQLPQGGVILEVGQASWYGDISPDIVPRDLTVHELYKQLFDQVAVVAIDLHGDADALKLNLNDPIALNEQFSVVFNHGTAEHIFDIARVFRTIHAHCEQGGLMIHESPLTGWFDHGFWNLQPTVYYDLAATNDYTIPYMAVTHIDHNTVVEIQSRDQLRTMVRKGGLPNNTQLFVALRKESDAAFKIPMQGLYSEGVDQETLRAWKELR